MSDLDLALGAIFFSPGIEEFLAAAAVGHKKHRKFIKSRRALHRFNTFIW